MTRIMDVMSLRFLLCIILLSTLCMPHLGTCYPIYSPDTVDSVETRTEADVYSPSRHSFFLQKRAYVGGESPISSDPRTIRSSPMWSNRNKLAIGLGVGLGAFLFFSGIVIFIGYHRDWHYNLFRRNRRVECSQISRPIFNTPSYNSAATMRLPVTEDRRPSYQSITTPPPIYTSMPQFPGPTEAYYQPLEIYRAMIGTAYPTEPQVSSPDERSTQLRCTSHLPLPPPPVYIREPTPPRSHLPSPLSASPLPATPAAPTLPRPASLPVSTSSGPALPITSLSDTCSIRRPLSASSCTSSNPTSIRCSPQDQQPQFRPAFEDQTLSLYAPTPLPLPSHVAGFLNALRSNSVDTNATNDTFIEEEAMSERSESVSPKTVPGSALRVQRPPRIRLNVPTDTCDCQTGTGLGIQMPERPREDEGNAQ